MKPSKKIKPVTPEVEEQLAYNAGTPTVKNLMNALSSLPEDAEVDIDGAIHINHKAFNGGTINVANKGYFSDHHDCKCDGSCNGDCGDNCVCNCDDEAAPVPAAVKSVLDEYFYGFAKDEVGMDALEVLRHEPLETVLEAPICVPCVNQQNYEESFSPAQRRIIDEIRYRNIGMVEGLTETYRRGMAALLEYNLQAQLRLTKATMVTMCDIVDGEK